MAHVRVAQLETSSSKNSSSKKHPSRYCSYHVFLSFRGDDTRKTFTDHLYTALVKAGFRTFLDDDDLKRGEDIKPELQKAIQRSQTSVVVISKNYASSRWCLDELVMILERKRSSADHFVLPVFYHVDPSHLRKPAGSIAEAFAKHQKTQSLNKVNRWREALAEVADLAGMVLENQADGYESKFINKIVKVIGDKLSRTPLSVSPNMIGMDYRARNINSWLQDGSPDIGILVMYGMSGIGKTTIAKYVYNSNFSRFEGSSFIENIREKSQHRNGLVQIQRQLLSDILNGRKVKIQSVSEGITKIEDAISCKKVLIVLDDMDHMDQFDAILRMRDQFYPGSKIIITTKRARLLRAHQVTEVHVGTLDYNESLKLFSWHAFGQEYPIEDYMKHSERVVHHCGGLPLALQILGSSLLGESIDVWTSALEKLEAIPNGEIMKKLRISYDSLQDDHDRKLFLHIACFFNGKHKDYIVKILDGCDFYTIIGIQNLVDRFLVTIYQDKVHMHDMICHMGKGIVRQESEEPRKRSRLWHHKDSFKVLREKNGMQTIEGLVLDMHMHLANSPIDSNESVLETNAFARMRELKLLHLNHVQLHGCFAKFPKGLRWLCWLEFPLNSIPVDFPLGSLVVLEMQYSSLRHVIYKGTKSCIPSLKILDLSHSHGLITMGDFSFCPNLEKLILVDCASLIEVHESVGNLEKLVYLNLKDCKNLRVLPKTMCMLKLLETLIISGCSSLKEFPGEMMKNMESLKVLETDEVPISELWRGSSCILSSLVSLSLQGCNLSDDAFPMDFGILSPLQRLDLANNPIRGLPNCIKGLTRLDELSFSQCTKLKSLVGLPKVGDLDVHGCISLEKITYQSVQFRGHGYSCGGTDNLVEWEYNFKLEPIERVGVEMINLLGLCNLESLAPIRMGTTWNAKWRPIQGLYERGIFSTFFAGNEVPGQFSHTSRGSSSISFNVPLLLHNHRIGGLIVFVVYAKSDNSSSQNHIPYPIIARVRNKSKGQIWWIDPSQYGIPGEGEDMTWLSYWNLMHPLLEGGDEVVVSVTTGTQFSHCQPSGVVVSATAESFQVKEFGIQLVQVPEENNMMMTTTQHNATADPCYPRVIGRSEHDQIGNIIEPYVYNWESDVYSDTEEEQQDDDTIRDTTEDTEEEQQEDDAFSDTEEEQRDRQRRRVTG